MQITEDMVSFDVFQSWIKDQAMAVCQANDNPEVTFGKWQQLVIDSNFGHFLKYLVLGSRETGGKTFVGLKYQWSTPAMLKPWNIKLSINITTKLPNSVIPISFHGLPWTINFLPQYYEMHRQWWAGDLFGGICQIELPILQSINDHFYFPDKKDFEFKDVLAAESETVAIVQKKHRDYWLFCLNLVPTTDMRKAQPLSLLNISVIKPEK